jgi:hypothetical protein
VLYVEDVWKLGLKALRRNELFDPSACGLAEDSEDVQRAAAFYEHVCSVAFVAGWVGLHCFLRV